jgi:hypothetical protein
LIHRIDVHDLDQNEEKSGDTKGNRSELVHNTLDVLHDDLRLLELLIDLLALGFGLIECLQQDIIF